MIHTLFLITDKYSLENCVLRTQSLTKEEGNDFIVNHIVAVFFLPQQQTFFHNHFKNFHIFGWDQLNKEFKLVCQPYSSLLLVSLIAH